MEKFGDEISWDDHVDQVINDGNQIYYTHGGDILTEAVSLIATDTPKNQRKALDCGCHMGRWIDVVRGYGLQYTGVDQSKKALDEARKNKPYGNFVHSFLWDMKFNEEFDFAMTVAVLQHNKHFEQAKIVPEIYKALKHGGVFFTTESTTWPDTGTQRTYPHWIEFIESFGFRFVKSFHKNPEGFDDHYIYIKD